MILTGFQNSQIKVCVSKFYEQANQPSKKSSSPHLRVYELNMQKYWQTRKFDFITSFRFF